MKKIKPFIFGISGSFLKDDEISLFVNNPVAGFILFKRNIESLEQLRSLINDLKSIYPDRDVPIFVDQEGGRVARIEPPLAQKLYQPAGYFADMYGRDKEEALKATKQNYHELTAELISLGISGPLAPVCDIRYEGASDVIGDRSFGDTAEKVIPLASAAIDGILGVGGKACIKHIPGHGRAATDSHHHLPFIETSLEELEKSDFKIFKDLSEKYPDIWAMTAHIVYNALDEKVPVTLSKKAINYIRDVIGFKGTLVSDAIEMKALHSHIFEQKQSNAEAHEIGERIIHSEDINSKQFIQSLCTVAKQTLDSGCDLVFHCTGDINEMTALCDTIS
jgi:beta-glucosidase